MMSGRLIGLDKCYGLRLVGVGETCRQMLANFVLVVMGVKAKEACSTEQICGGL